MRLLTQALLALPCVPTMALAATPAALVMETPFSPEFNQCISLSVGTLTALRDCMTNELVRLERKLTDTWNTPLARLPNNAAKSLMQQTCAKWMDQTPWAPCKAQSGMADEMFVGERCRLGVIAQRISWLETYLPDAQGTPTAP